MRKGKNISKEQPIQINTFGHRIIIPLYIPHEKDYYIESWQIFEMCILSLIKTTTNNSAISIISNGCSKAINNKLFAFCQELNVDQLIIEKRKIGKINSLLRALKTIQEPIVTIADADILFLNGWYTNTLQVFKEVPKAAAVSPMPVFRTQNHYTSNLIFDFLFSSKLKFTQVANPEDLTAFAKSIGWSHLDDKWKDYIMTLKTKTEQVVVGCNHAVVTYRSEIFKKQTNAFASYALGGATEGYYLDKLPQLFDGYRLATEKAYAMHMGNHLDEILNEEFEGVSNEENILSYLPPKELTYKPIKHFFKNVLFKKLMNQKFFRRFVYLQKGLPSEKLKNFI